jgi:hypothetical protein
VTSNATDQGHPVERWQYLVEDCAVHTSQARNEVAALEQRCTELGLQGWELVSVAPLARSYGATHALRLFFKRPRPSS